MLLSLSRDLGPLKVAALQRIDREAELERRKYITAGSGQAMMYAEKLAEAEAYLADENIAEDMIPHIVAEVGVTGDTKFDVAVVVVSMRNLWKQVSAAIEAKRLTAKALVEDATTPTEIDAAAQVSW